jgi:aspartyl-tRNA(Asn)/glutamyl-tRNA(Gln) amidotransferase subunit C
MADKLTRGDVLKVARLARLKLTDAEVDDYTEKLGSILEYVASLNEIDTEDVEPMVHAVELSNVFRADEVAPSLPREAALKNAPKTDGQFFLVPQILDAE